MTTILSLFISLSLCATMTEQKQVTKEELIAMLLESNRETAPFKIYDGSDEGVDLIAEWRIVDAEWQTIFAKAGKKKVFKIKMKLNDKKKQFRTKDEEYTVDWRNGIASMSLSKSKFKGKKMAIGKGKKKKVLFTETTEDNVIYEYSFNTEEMRNHIKEVVANSGWKYKEVIFKKL